MAIDLHELINNPGAGKHIPVLEKAGAWDEWAGLTMRKWQVEVEGTVTETQYYTVTARHKDEAYDKADKLAKKNYDEFDMIEAEELK